MNKLGWYAFCVTFWGLVATVALMFVQDYRTSSYCNRIGLGWHKTESAFSMNPVAVCITTKKHALTGVKE